LARDLDRLWIAGVDVTRDTKARIGGQDAAQPSVGLLGPVGYADLARVDRLAHPDAAAVVDRDPARAAGRVQQAVEQGPVADGVGAVEHRLGLALGRGDRAGVEVVAPDHDRTAQRAV